MDGLVESIRAWPWWWAWTAFLVIVLLRACGTYALGRATAAGVWRGRTPGDRLARASDEVHRWGPVAVTLSFLTVGAQTVVNFAAGLARMTVPRYLVGLLPGAIIWATIWSTIGMSAFYAVFTGDGSRAAWVLVLVVLGTVAVLLARAFRLR